MTQGDALYTYGLRNAPRRCFLQPRRTMRSSKKVHCAYIRKKQKKKRTLAAVICLLFITIFLCAYTATSCLQRSTNNVQRTLHRMLAKNLCCTERRSKEQSRVPFGRNGGTPPFRLASLELERERYAFKRNVPLKKKKLHEFSRHLSFLL